MVESASGIYAPSRPQPSVTPRPSAQSKPSESRVESEKPPASAASDSEIQASLEALVASGETPPRGSFLNILV